jgi:hypothetical protein
MVAIVTGTNESRHENQRYILLCFSFITLRCGAEQNRDFDETPNNLIVPICISLCLFFSDKNIHLL